MEPPPLAMQRDDSDAYAGIVTLVLEQPDRPVVVLDDVLIRRLDEALDRVPDDARGVVLASGSPKVFVAGADLTSIDRWPDDQLAAYLEMASRVYAKLANLPCPTVAAIHGATLGGGLELAMHCDGMIAAPGAKPYPVGLPEAGLGLCPGWGGTNLLPARMDAAEAIRLTASGKTMMFEDATQAGLFDEVVDDASALDEACKRWLVEKTGTGGQDRDGAPRRWIGRPEFASDVLSALDEIRSALPDTEPARAVAACVDVGLTKGWHGAIEAEQEHLVSLRHTPEARAALKAFFEKSARK